MSSTIHFLIGQNELLKERCEISFLQQSHLAQKSLLGLCQKSQKKEHRQIKHAELPAVAILCE